MKAPLLFLGLIIGVTVQAQPSVATLFVERQTVTVSHEDEAPVDVTANDSRLLHEGEVIQAEAGGSAVIVYHGDNTPLEKIGSGEVYTVAGPAATNGSAVEPSGASMLGSIARTLIRILGGNVTDPSEPRIGGGRGSGNEGLALALPETSKALDRHPTLSWWPASNATAQTTYQLAVVSGADSTRCWKGGDVLWEASTQDTTWVYPDEAPTLTSDALYRVELWTSDGEGDYACLDVASEEKRVFLLESKAALDEEAADADPVTREVLWASVLIERGYAGRAWSLLEQLLQAHPEHTTAQKLQRLLVSQATQ